jgi:tagaturonate reductase
MENILQLGEGNFLRAFIEEYIDEEKLGSVAICQPRNNTRVINALNEQDCKYNIILRGRLSGSVVDETKSIDCVSRAIDTISETDKLVDIFVSDELHIVVSNTTEAGICFDDTDKITQFPNVSFPAKVTYLLYKRFSVGKKPLIFLPVELIENNGTALKNCIENYARLWNFGDKFLSYVNECHFCNTLVDRIVTGHIENDEDACSVACEPYKAFIIEADDYSKQFLPYGSTVVFTEDITPYRIRKVRILNGAHTMSVLAGYLAGFDIVRDMMNDELFANYIDAGLEEIKATIDMNTQELDDFANSVKERFNNPFIDHKLLDISLNSVAKFKARVLPTIIDYIAQNGCNPKILTFSLSALIAFYMHVGSNRDYLVLDSDDVLKFFDNLTCENAVHNILSNVDFWDEDLTKISGFEFAVQLHFNNILNNGIIPAIREVLYE